MSKVNNRDTRTMSMASLWCLFFWLWTYFTPCSSVSIVKFEQVNANWGFGIKSYIIDVNVNSPNFSQKWSVADNKTTILECRWRKYFIGDVEEIYKISFKNLRTIFWILVLLERALYEIRLWIEVLREYIERIY